MTIVLGDNRYGKSRVRLMKVSRGAEQHRVDEWNLEVWLEGNFEHCFQDGDNSEILPTDTMKNTVYSLARSSSASSMEHFAIELATHFIETNSYAQLAGVRITSTPWKHLNVNGALSPNAFTHGGDHKDTTIVTNTRATGLTIRSGFEDMWLLKTAKSAFFGFLRDRLTTLPETNDRLFGTLAKVEWHYSADLDAASADFTTLRAKTEAALLTAFAHHDSLSVQQTLYAMAGAALEGIPEINALHLALPNKHCNLVDLSRFGQDNPNLIFVPTDEPHGSIEAHIRRGE